jgi:hypothetical protein
MAVVPALGSPPPQHFTRGQALSRLADDSDIYLSRGKRSIGVGLFHTRN